MSARVHTLTRVTFLPHAPEAVFPFFADARNLERITPPELRFEIRTPGTIEMHDGQRIAYRLSLFAIRSRWLTEIRRWNPPFAFEDVQLRGPYRSWRHQHVFEPVPGGTRMTDVVHYELPLAPVGELAGSVVRRQLERIFDYRSAEMPTALRQHVRAA